MGWGNVFGVLAADSPPKSERVMGHFFEFSNARFWMRFAVSARCGIAQLFPSAETTKIAKRSRKKTKKMTHYPFKKKPSAPPHHKLFSL